jgi:hypothetical protein
MPRAVPRVVTLSEVAVRKANDTQSKNPYQSAQQFAAEGVFQHDSIPITFPEGIERSGLRIFRVPLRDLRG